MAEEAIVPLMRAIVAGVGESAEYEDTDSSRWAVSPTSEREIQAELKPVSHG